MTISLSRVLWTWALMGALSLAIQGTPQAPAENRWRVEHEAGLKALGEGRYPQAILSFEAAIAEAQKLGGSSQQLADSINGLGQSYLQQGNYVTADRLFQQSLGILEKVLGPDHPAVAGVLSDQARVYRLQEKYVEAVAPARRSLGILEKAYGVEHPNVAIGLNNLALILRLDGGYEEARLLSLRSLSILEKALGPNHPNVAIGLNNLVLIQHLQGRDGEAEPLARRALSILKNAPGQGTANLVQSLDNLAAICLALGKLDESEQLYRHSLNVRWGNDSAEADIFPVLEKFADLLNLTYSPPLLDKAREVFGTASGWSAAGVNLYVLMGQALRERGMMGDAEAVLQRAIEAFPLSLEARYELAQVYAVSLRSRTALDTLIDAARMRNPVDRQQYGRVYDGIAKMYALVFNYDEALAHFKIALDANPGSIPTRVALADLYLQLGNLDEAAAEYAQAILLSGGTADAYFGVAELNLRTGHLSESVAAADRAIEMDPKDSRFRYTRAVALLRAGRTEEGEAEMENFRTLEAEERVKRDRTRVIPVLVQSAMAMFDAGQQEEALHELEAGVRSYPDAAAIFLNLGIVQSRLGKHQDAVQTFQSMKDLEYADSFLVHLNLSREYETLGDIATSRAQRDIFLQKYSAALRNDLR